MADILQELDSLVPDKTDSGGADKTSQIDPSFGIEGALKAANDASRSGKSSFTVPKAGGGELQLTMADVSAMAEPTRPVNYSPTVTPTKQAPVKPSGNATLLDSLDSLVPKKKSMYDVVYGPSLKPTKDESAYDPEVGMGEFQFNAAKKGLMAVPGMAGSIVKMGSEVKAAIGQDTKTPKSFLETVMDVAGSLNPITLPLRIIEAEQRSQKAADAPFMSGDYMAQKLLGAKPNMKAPSKEAEMLGDVTEFVASAPLGVVREGVEKGLAPAVKKLIGLTATAAGAVAGGEAAQASLGEGETQKAVGEVASIVPMALLHRWGSYATREGRQIIQDTYAGVKKDVNTGLGGAVENMVDARLAKGIASYSKSIANIKEATALQKTINEAVGPEEKVRVSAGRATGAPAVMADELAARSSSNAAVASALDADRKNSSAVLKYIAGTDQPPQGVSRKSALDTAITAAAAKRQALIDEGKTLQKNSQRLAESVTPKLTPQGRGETLIEQRAKEKAREDVISKSLYDAARVEAEKVGATFSADAIQLKARQLSANPILAYDDKNLPSVIHNIRVMLTGVEGEVAPSLLERGLAAESEEGVPKELTYRDITSLREAVNQDISVELRSTNPNKRQRLRALTEMKNTVDGAIAESEHDSVKKLYNAATNYYRDVYSPKFNKGINSKLSMTDSFGDQKILDEKILDQYSASPTRIDGFLKLFGKNPEALAVMEDHMLDKFSKAVVKDGLVNPKAYALFVKRNADVLRKLDRAGVNSLGRFQNVGAKVKELSDRQAVLTANEEKLAKDELTNLLGTADHEKIVLTALSNPAAMGRLTNILGQTGSKALSSSVMRDFMRKITYPQGSDKIGINFDAMNKWLTANQKSVSIMFNRAYGPVEGAAHMQRLKDASRMIAILDRVKTPAISSGDVAIGKDPLKEKIGITFRSLWSFVRAIKTGRTSESDMAVALGGQAGTHFMLKAYNDLMQSIASDPESSKFLINLAKTGGKPVLTKKESIMRAKALASAAGKLGYYYLGGRYYGPSLRTLLPVILSQQAEGP